MPNKTVRALSNGYRALRRGTTRGAADEMAVRGVNAVAKYADDKKKKRAVAKARANIKSATAKYNRDRKKRGGPR